MADVVLQPAEEITGSSFLAFAGVLPSQLPVYPRETHIAEKLHAYTLPRPRENTRVKDLPDLALLATTGPFEGELLRKAIEATFAHRKTHPVPPEVPDPPSSWVPVYERMARLDGLPWRGLADLTLAVRQFLDPVLGGVSKAWRPDAWVWL